MSESEDGPPKQTAGLDPRIPTQPLFLCGSVLGVLTLIRPSGFALIQIGHLGVTAFALGLAGAASNGVPEGRYVRSGVAILLLVGLGAITLGVQTVPAANIAQILTGAYLPWLVFRRSLVDMDIYVPDNPIKGGGGGRRGTDIRLRKSVNGNTDADQWEYQHKK